MMRNFHLPLPPELYEKLKSYSKKQKQPATVLAREAIEEWIKQQERDYVRQEISMYAKKHARSNTDLDEDLESASIEHLNEQESKQ